MILLRLDWIDRSPRNGVKEIQFIGNQWILILDDGQSQNYQELQILIHNVLFQLIRFTNLGKNRYIILFIDQISVEQLRFLHLKSAIISSTKD